MGLARRSPARHRSRSLARGLLTRRPLTLVVAALALALVAPTAEAAFDPVDGTVINANLPTSVPLSYGIDLDAQCGAGASATVTAWLRDPGGAERRVHQDSGYGSAFEASFGADLSAYGTYARWLDVACGGSTRRIEEGSFTLVAGDAGALKVQCARAKRAVTKARKDYRGARKALRRKDTAPRRRAVRRTRAKLRTARTHSRKACTKH